MAAPFPGSWCSITVAPTNCNGDPGLAPAAAGADGAERDGAAAEGAAAGIKEAASAEGGRRPQKSGETCGPALAWGRAGAQWAAENRRPLLVKRLHASARFHPKLTREVVGQRRARGAIDAGAAASGIPIPSPGCDAPASAG
jgi:hypothetical protein